MDKLRSMEVFVGVVAAGSFTAAARQFELSTVMVGKHIASLEQQLGARLLTRTTRRQALTEIGVRYHQQCQQILGLVRQAETGAEAMRSGARGTLKVSAPVAFGSECLAPALADYLARHPEVAVDLELGPRVVDIIDEGFDAAIRIGVLDDSSLVARPLRAYGMVICAAPSYLERHGWPRTAAELAQHQCLDFLHWKRLVRWRLDGGDGQCTPPQSRFRSNNGQALKRAALAGLGIVMQAEIVLQEELRSGQLVRLLQEHVPPARPMHLVYPRDRQATPKQTSFIEFVLARFGK
jgi:DNA-binding transcriptional LysR family regulator